MNVLILTHSYPDNEIRWRGAFIQEQARALSLKHRVFVVFFKTDYSRFAPFSAYSFKKSADDSVTVYELTVARSFPVVNQLKYFWDTYRFINKEILQHEYIDIIHSHLSYPAGFLGTIIQKKKKIPNVLTEHTWIKKHFRSRIHRWCVMYALRNAGCVIAVSNALKDDIGQYCDREAEVVPNVVSTGRFSIASAVRNNLNLGILGGMGNYRKGLDILLQAAALLKNIDFTIHIGGDGKYLPEFKELSKELGIYDRCIFYGEIKPEDVNRFYSKLDIYTLPSRDETFGVVVVEAMAGGLPVIASKCGGPQEIITKDTGLLVEKENPRELAEAIEHMSENLSSYDKVKIRDYAIRKYGPEAFVTNVTHIYKKLLSRQVC